jgi:hypothetical protein
VSKPFHTLERAMQIGYYARCVLFVLLLMFLGWLALAIVKTFPVLTLIGVSTVIAVGMWNRRPKPGPTHRAKTRITTP